MTFRVPVTRSLLVVLCLSLIVPWSTFSTSVAADVAGPSATPVPIVLDETPAPESDVPDPSDVEAGEPGGLTPEPADSEDLPGPVIDEEGSSDDLAPEAGEDAGMPDVDSTPAPLGRPGDADQPAVGTLAVDESTLTVTVSMYDGTVIPPGISLAGSWDGYTEGVPVPAGATQVDVTFPSSIPYGDYDIMLRTNLFSIKTIVILDSPVETVEATIPVLLASAAVTLRTSDDGVIPAGTRWTLKHVDSTVLSGVFAAPMISGTSFTIGPAFTNTYELTIAPPEDGAGRQFQEQSVPVDLYSAEDNNWEIDLAIQNPLATVSLSVAMADAGTIPAGLEWSLLPAGSWDPIATGPVTAGGTTFSHVIPEQVPYGSYQLWIDGNGYSSGQTISAQSATAGYDFTLTRLMGTLDVTLNTSDGDTVPEGTVFELMSGSTVISSFTVDSTLPTGSVYPLGAYEFGVYELKVSPPVDSPDRQVMPQTITINMNNPWATEYNIDVNLEVFTPMSTVTVTVVMDDGGEIPHGLIMFPAWDVSSAGIPVPGGSTSVEIPIADLVPYGTYELMFTNNAVFMPRFVTVDAPVDNVGVSLFQYEASSQITLNTSDGGVIPAGTQWAVMSGDLTVLSGVLTEPMASGSMLNVGPVFVGEYQFAITPPADSGDRQFISLSEPLNISWLSTNGHSFNLEVIPATSTVSVAVAMSDGGEIPMGLQWSLLPAGSWDPIATGPVTAGGTLFEHDIPEQVPYGTYQLWIDGNGYSSGQTISAQSATVGHDFTLTRLMGTMALTLNTSDGGDVPMGTTFEVMSGSTVVANYTVDASVPGGSVLPVGTQEFGVYELKVSPPVDSPDRQVVPQTITINMNNPWFTEYDIDVNLDVFTPMSTVTVSVEMTDGGEIPMGLQWSIMHSGNWDPIATGPVTAGGTTFSHDIPEQVPYGVYQLWITGNGYSTGQVINVQSDTFHHGFSFDRLYGNLAITVTTSDGSDIPAGTAWELRDANDTVLQSGTLAEKLPNGSMLEVANPLEFGVYTLSFKPGTDMLVAMSLADLPRDLLPYSTIINVTNPWFTEYAVAAELQWAQSDVTFSVAMSDSSPLPNGLTWMLVVSGSWDPLASGTVTAGEITFAGQVPEPAPFGVYELWITGNGYSSGQVLNIQELTTHHDFVLDRLAADVTVTMDTSDDAAIPAGTTWSIVDSAGNPVQNGVLAEDLPDGSTLPLANPLTFDVYTLTIDAEGYHPVTMELAVTNPWLTEMSFTANLVSDRLPEPPVDPATPSPEPTVDPATPSPEPTVDPVTPAPVTPAPVTPAPVTPAPVTPAPATPAPVTPASAAPVTGLPQTGVASDASTMATSLVIAAGIVLAAGTGILLRSRTR